MLALTRMHRPSTIQQTNIHKEELYQAYMKNKQLILTIISPCTPASSTASRIAASWTVSSFSHPPYDLIKNSHIHKYDIYKWFLIQVLPLIYQKWYPWKTQISGFKYITNASDKI